MRKKEQNLIRLQELARTDPQYISLTEEHKLLDARFQTVMEALPPAQREAIGDYLGLMGEMGRYMLLLACENMGFGGFKL